MTVVADLTHLGLLPLQDHRTEVPEQLRSVLYAGRVERRDSAGRYQFFTGTKGDVLGTVFWQEIQEQRPTGAWWMSCAAAIVASGAATGEGNQDGDGGSLANESGELISISGVRTDYSAGSPNAGAGFTGPNGVRPDFNNGSPNTGVDVGLLNQTTLNEPGQPSGFETGEDPTQGGPPPGADTPSGQDPNDAGGGVFSVLPIGKRMLEPDQRFEPKTFDNLTQLWGVLPGGSLGIVVATTDERHEVDMFLPCDRRLVAVNHAGNPECGSPVFDLTGGNEYDPERYARLQSAFRVLKKPPGWSSNCLGFQLSQSGKGDTRGGFVVDTSQGGGDTAVEGELPIVVGFLSVQDGGFIDLGDGKCKHAKGADEDGHPYVQAHISTKALFRMNNTMDGPLRFELEYKEGDDLEKVVPVHLGWTGADWAWWTTTSIGPPPPGEKSIDQKPKKPYGGTLVPNPLPGGPGVIGGDPQGEKPPGMGRPGSPGGYGGVKFADPVPSVDQRTGERRFMDESRRYHEYPPAIPEPFTPTPEEGPQAPILAPWAMPPQVMATNQAAGPAKFLEGYGQLAMTGFLARAQTQDPKKLDLANALGATPAAQQQMSETPMSGQLMAWGAQGGLRSSGYGTTEQGAAADPWNYTQKPRTGGKYECGTASGGFLIAPPEVYMGDLGDALAPVGLERSTTYMLAAPNAWFGAGLPELSDGSIQDGWSWGMDETTGDLLFRSHTDGGTPASGVKFVVATQDIAWRSGTSFWGTFMHANSVDRNYTFPDFTGTVLVGLQTISLGGGAAATLGTIGGGGPTVATQDKWIDIKRPDGTTCYIPCWI